MDFEDMKVRLIFRLTDSILDRKVSLYHLGYDEMLLGYHLILDSCIEGVDYDGPDYE